METGKDVEDDAEFMEMLEKQE
jgi:hypothetical protein